MPRSRGWTTLLALLLTAACTRENRADDARAGAETATEPAAVAAPNADVYWDSSSGALSPEELERGRLDPSWRDVAPLDSVAWGDSAANPETWDSISVASVNDAPMRLPLHGEGAGPSVLRVQVLLDRALFSPGIIDGRWGKNTEKALYWLQKREGLPATGGVDEKTFARLTALAGEPTHLVREHRLTEKDVAGPFTKIPSDIYAQAKLDCSCYESLGEKLGELFHTTPEVLRKLNPGADLDALAAGQTLHVPAVRSAKPGSAGQVARLVVSDRGSYVHALDASGRVVYHFPSTLGSSYDPSPSGDYRVKSITEDPWWHYQPAILAHVDSSKPDANIPPGPNNAVGVVWMALSKPHYGIHGTSHPETIGYTSSAGCVRLTNWDALFLARSIHDGIAVEFRDTRSN
jgi:lipoprotein-anchoring transpeptidase ErfK/SrfK